MIRLFIFIVLTALLVVCGVWFADNPGQLHVTWLGYRYDGSVGMVVLALFVLCAVIILLWRGWQAIANSPSLLGRLLGSRRRKKGQQALTMGLLELASGDVKQALKHTRTVDRYLEDDTLTRLLTAQVAQLEGNHDAARHQFEAMLKDKKSEFFGLRGLLELSLRLDDRKAALIHARRAHQLRPRNTTILSTLFDLLLSAEKWDEALDILGQIQKEGLVKDDEAKRRRCLLLTAKAREAIGASRLDEALKLLRKALNTIPDFMPAAVLLAELHLKQGQKSKAHEVIRQAWSVNPSAALADLFLDSLDGDALGKVKAAQKLAETHPKHVESELLVARAALGAELWGLARTNLEKAIRQSAEARHYRLMADLELHEKHDENLARTLLIKATHANPDPSWRCGACGSKAPNWMPVCPSCDNFGSINWYSSLLGEDDDERAGFAELPSGTPKASPKTGISSGSKPANAEDAVIIPPSK